MARSLAGAMDLGDLLRRILVWLDPEQQHDSSARLWLLAEGHAEPLVRHPAGRVLPAVPMEIVSRVASGSIGSIVSHDGADLVSLSTEEETLGVLEIRPGLVDGRTRLAQVAGVAGARIGSLATAQRQRERLPANVPIAGNAQEIQDVVSAFAAEARRLLDHDRLSIYLLTPDGAALERFAVATSPIQPGEGDVIPLEQVGLTRVIKKNEPLVSADFGSDDRILGLEDSVIARAGFHGLVSVPLRVAAKPFGILNFVSKTAGFYAEADIAVAQQIADEVSVFLQNLRLQDAIRTAVEREAITRERNRVAHEFHDTLAQMLSLIAARAFELLEDPSLPDGAVRGHAEAIQQLSQAAIEDARRTLRDMLPSQLENASLVEAIESALDQMRQEEGIVASLSVDGDIDRLPESSQIAVFRIFSEAIANVRRHAGATTVAVHVVESAEELRVSICDNGGGIRADILHGNATTFGIETMRERSRAVGGRLVISSTPGSGTEVFLHLPSRQQPAKRHINNDRMVEGPGLTRVLIVDDHPMFREGLGKVLSQDVGVRLVGEAGTGKDAITQVAMKRPDVVLLDLDLPDCSGIDLIGRIVDASPSTAVVIVSAFAGTETVAAAIQAGARGYVQKISKPRVVIDAVHAAMNDDMVLTPSVQPPPQNSFETLTPRELEVLKGIALGKTNAEIGGELFIADKTVERVVATIASKLRAKNRAHAVAKGVAWKLVDARQM